MSLAGKFVVKTASNGEVYFRLHAGNGEAILKSEMYSSKAAALNGIESVCRNAPTTLVTNARPRRAASSCST